MSVGNVVCIHVLTGDGMDKYHSSIDAYNTAYELLPTTTPDHIMTHHPILYTVPTGIPL